MTDYDSLRQMIVEDEAKKFREDYEEFNFREEQDTLNARKEIFEKLEAEYK